MILIFSLVVVIWGVGWALNTPRSARLNMTGLLFIAVIGLHLLLPDGHPIRENTGGGAGFWLLLLGFGVVFWGYARLLQKLRKKASLHHEPVPTNADSLTDAELSRYSRHIILREIGGPGQKALRNAKVLVVGAGGLGAPALQYLAAAGVGVIGVIDDDIVDVSNLQRQTIHTTASIGLPKVRSAAATIKALNPLVEVRPYERRLTEEIAVDLLLEFDLVLDGTDNFDTRYLLNKLCHRTKRPLIAAAITQWEGQISVYDSANGTPCYQCAFPKTPDPALVPSCAEGGVLGPLPGIIGAMMAAEAVKLICDAGELLKGRLMIFDALYAETRTITIKSRPDCPICGAH